MKSAISINDTAGFGKEDVIDLEDLYVSTLASECRNGSRQGVFHPSAIGSCGRRNVYEYIRTPAIPTIDPDSSEIFTLGHAVHDIVQSRLGHLTEVARRGLSYEARFEVPYDPETDALYKDYGIGGTTDGIIRIWGAGWEQRGILEVKSMKSKMFDELSEPKPDHLMQAHLYAYRFDCPIIWVWYYNKDTSKRVVYTRIFDPDVLVAALDKYGMWMSHVIDGTLPDREESWFACPRCEYRDACQPSVLAKIRGKAGGKTTSALRSAGRLKRNTYA